MLLLTLRGTPTLYYGDELGMTNVAIPVERVQDPLERNVPGKGLGRDSCRTPMQWNQSEYGGFSGAAAWLPLADNYRMVNVESEQHDACSALNLYRRLLAMRRASAALCVGEYLPLYVDDQQLAYIRHAGTERLLIALNLSDSPCALPLESLGLRGCIRLSTHLDRAHELTTTALGLRANEGLIVTLTAEADAPHT